MAGGGKRAVAVWHRRAGKDNLALNRIAVEAHKRTGTYWHMLPQQAQARKVVWDGMDGKTGIKFLEQAFPQEIRSATNSQEMKLTLKCGSVFQLCGSDNYDSLIGSNPVGVVFSEYSVANPASWNYIRPILAENGGWAIFIYTPRGHNHGYELFNTAKREEDWFAEILTVDDTHAISPAAIQKERDSGMLEEMINQEFYCSFEGSIVGAYFGEQIQQAVNDRRIKAVPHEPSLLVHTGWDLGISASDHMCIWFYQCLRGGEVRVIDYIEDHSKGLEYYAKMLDDKPYNYGYHFGPHDIKVRELGTGRSRLEVAADLGIDFTVVPAQNPIDRIQAARVLLGQCYIDEDKCKQGLEGLRHYHREWDEINRTFKTTPMHDWASHPADAFGTFAVGYEIARDDQYYDDEGDYEDYERERMTHHAGRSEVGGY